MSQAPVRLVREGQKPDPMRFGFTVRKLEQIKAGDKQKWVYDEHTRGLAMLTLPSGFKTFYFAGRMNGRYRRVKIGPFPGTTIENARKAAVRELNKVVEGRNPADERKRSRVACDTFGDLCKLWLDDWKGAKGVKRTIEEDRRRIDKHLESWKSRRMDAIDRDKVRRLHRKIGEKAPYEANRLLKLIGAMYRKAIREERITGPNPASEIDAHPEQTRQGNHLDARELPAFIAALDADAEVSQTASDALWTLLLTAQRRSNALAMAWADVDLDRETWTIARTKRGKPHTVPLVGKVLEIVKRRHDDPKRHDIYVFPSRITIATTAHFSDPIPALKRVLKAASVKRRFTPHDLRRTWATWAHGAGVQDSTIKEALDHSRKGDITFGVYSNVSIDTLREAFKATEQAMLAAKGGE
ncbi:MAG: tyrosine-type recombinase/integrase [Phycisphaeraceae bacterium]